MNFVRVCRYSLEGGGKCFVMSKLTENSSSKIILNVLTFLFYVFSFYHIVIKNFAAFKDS